MVYSFITCGSLPGTREGISVNRDILHSRFLGEEFQNLPKKPKNMQFSRKADFFKFSSEATLFLKEKLAIF